MPAGFMAVGRRRSARVRAQRLGHRRARVGVAAAPACASRGDRRSRPPGSAQSHPRAGSCIRCWVSTRCALLAGAIKPSRESLDRRMHAAPGQLVDVGGHRLHLNCAGIGYSHRHPRIRPWRDCRVLGMDLDRGRTRHESVRLRPRGSRLERSGFCPAGRCRRGHGPPHPARSRARSGSVCARRPFVGRAVRADLRRPVSRTGRRNGLARRPTCRSVRESSDLSCASTPSSAASLRCCRRWLDSASGG